jgi:TPR repeat protein
MRRVLLAAALAGLLAGPAVASWKNGVKYLEKGDYERAASFFRRVAPEGDVRAQFALGILYLNGKGVERNEERGANWIRRAAKRELPPAQTLLGTLYRRGRGVAQSDAEAGKWYRRAAEFGDAEGQTALGMLSHLGQGVRKSNLEAYVWLSLAERQGNELAAKHRQLLQSSLSTVQRAVADRRIRDWKPKKAPRMAKWHNLSNLFHGVSGPFDAGHADFSEF